MTNDNSSTLTTEEIELARKIALDIREQMGKQHIDLSILSEMTYLRLDDNHPLLGEDESAMERYDVFLEQVDKFSR